MSSHSLDTSETRDFEEGNTIEPPRLRSRNWFFTLNNYTPKDIAILDTLFQAECVKYCFQEELSASGTPHLQGTCVYKNARMFTAMRAINSKIHWETTKNVTKSFEYCSKPETRNGNIYTNIEALKAIELDIIDTLYPWQQEVAEICNTKPNNRTINWYWSRKGNNGKTALCKYMYSKKGDKINIFNNGGTKDIAFALSTGVQIVFFNIVRSLENKCNYTALEQVKDGLIFSGKYESAMKIFNSPHVFVFANFAPKLDNLSEDRWRIINLDEI